MATSSLKHLSFKAIPSSDLENADEVQLKTMAHSLLESKLEKMMSTAGTGEQISKTKQLAVEWMRKWDLDGDGVLSSVEMKGAAMEHARLQRDYKSRGIWMIVLALVIFCCGGVILGVSIWANAISKDNDVKTGDDLGGYTMRKKDGSAVVKTATALYNFPLPRIGYVPFDELSTIKSISFLHNKALRQMSVSRFKWFGANNITFFSPRGEQLTITRSEKPYPSLPSEQQWLSISMREPHGGELSFIYDDFDHDFVFRTLLFATLDEYEAQGVAVTLDLAYTVSGMLASFMIDAQLPPECQAPAKEVMLNMSGVILQPCQSMLTMLLQGYGVVEAGVGPQDYYGTEMSSEEKEELLGTAYLGGARVFIPDQANMLDAYIGWLKPAFRERYG